MALPNDLNTRFWASFVTDGSGNSSLRVVSVGSGAGTLPALLTPSLSSTPMSGNDDWFLSS